MSGNATTFHILVDIQTQYIYENRSSVDPIAEKFDFIEDFEIREVNLRDVEK